MKNPAKVTLACSALFSAICQANVQLHAPSVPVPGSAVSLLSEQSLPYELHYFRADDYGRARLAEFRHAGGLALVEFTDTLTANATLATLFGTGIATRLALVLIPTDGSPLRIAPISERDEEKAAEQVKRLAEHLLAPRAEQAPRRSKRAAAMSMPGGIVQDTNVRAFNSYVVLEGEGQIFDIAVEVFHNTRDHIKLARLTTEGPGYTRSFYRAKTNDGDGFTAGYARYRLDFPLEYEFSFQPVSGNGPVRVNQYSPDNPPQGVSVMAGTDIGFSLNASASSEGTVTGGGAFSMTWSKRTTWNTQDYTVRAAVEPSDNRKVSWKTSLFAVRGYTWADYGKWLGIYHYTSCSDDNLVYENEWPKPATSYTPKFQYVVRLDNSDPKSAAYNGVTVIKANSKYTVAEEKYLRDWCSWYDDGSRRIEKQKSVDITINWGDSRLKP